MSVGSAFDVLLSPPFVGGGEAEALQEVLHSGWLAPAGPPLLVFEAALEQASGSPHVLAVSSGTAALHLALDILGVGPGDEVLVQSLTFVGGVNPVRYLGADPVFVDSEATSWNLSPYWLEKALEHRLELGKRVKAVILTHLYGRMAQMDEIMAICQRYGIDLIEDATEALGSTYKGKGAGTFGRMGALSFNGNKIITTSGGGALQSNRKDDIDLARKLATQGREPAPHYQHERIAYNYRLSSVSAGLGTAQLKTLDYRVARRRHHYAYYQKRLGQLPGVSFLPEQPGTFENCWLSTLLIDPALNGGITPTDVRLALEQARIEARPLWKPMHLQPLYADCPFYGDHTADRLFEQGLCLPSGTGMTDEELDRVCRVVEKAFGR